MSDADDDLDAGDLDAGGSLAVQVERLRGLVRVDRATIKTQASAITELLATQKDFREFEANLKGGIKVIAWAGGIMGLVIGIIAALFSGKFSR